jgi:microcystin-dependent protein
MAERGEVRAVAWMPLGSELTADATIGALLLTIDNSVDFDEDGGSFDLNGIQYDYSSVDHDTGTLTLETSLTVAAVAGDRVNVWSGGQVAIEYTAFVSLGDGDEVEVPIPYSDRDLWPEGEYTDPVLVTLSDDLESLIGVPGRTPIRDGSFIDPSTLPPPEPPEPEPPTDGLVPSSSPVPLVVGGIGAFFVRWAAVPNADPLTYALHVSPTSGFTPDATTLAVSTTGNSHTIRKLPVPVGTPASAEFKYDTPYYFRIIARDDDGEGPVGAEGSDVMVKITSPDIAAENVTGIHIKGGTITGDLLSSDVVLGSKISTGQIDQTAGSPTFGQIVGQRVEMDTAGIRLVNPGGSTIINLPTASGQVAKFEGEISAKTLTVTDGATFQKQANTLAIDSSLTMASGQGEPVVSPTAAIGYETKILQTLAVDGPLGNFALVPGEVSCICNHSTAGVMAVVQNRPNGSRIWFYSKSTGQTVLVNGYPAADNPDWRITGMALHGGNRLVYLFQYNGGYWYLYDPNQTQLMNFYTPLNAAQDPALGHDGTNLIVGENDGNTLKVRTLTWNNTGGSTPVVTVASTTTYGAATKTNQSLAYVGKGNFDFGSSQVVYAGRGVQYGVYVLPSASGSVQDDTKGFPSGTSNRRGMLWDASFGFYTLGSDGTLIRHSNQLLPVLNTCWFGLTWRNATSTRETKLGPMSSIPMVRRARMIVTVPPTPGGSGSDAPTAFGLYTYEGTVAPAAAGMRLQYNATPAAGQSLTYNFTHPVTSGAAPPVANNFPNATSAIVKSQQQRADGSPKIRLDGAGAANVDGLLPPGSITMWAGTVSPPAGWLICDGTSKARTLYPDLFAAIGTTFGSVDGSSFTLPNMTGKVPRGGAAPTTGGGSDTVTMPDHTHVITQHDHGLGAGVTQAVPTGTGGGQRMTGAGQTGQSATGIQSGVVTGANPPISNIPAHVVLVFIIKT